MNSLGSQPAVHLQNPRVAVGNGGVILSLQRDRMK